jgi:hypothetical protein
LDLKKNKAPNNVSTINNKTFKLRAELKELKEAVFVVDATGANAYGDVPVSLSQMYWDTGNRTVIGWDAIHKLAAEQTAEQTPNDGAKRGVVNAVVNATSVEEDNTSSEVKWPSWPSGSSWPSPRPCGACRPTPR